MPRFAIALLICAGTVRLHADPPAPASARILDSTIHRNEQREVEVRIVNTTDEPETFRIMSCSWADQWRTDDPAITVATEPCDKNFETTLTLTPGATDLRRLRITATSTAALGDHALRVGFTAIGAKTTLWTAKLAVRVVGVDTGITIANNVNHRIVTFDLANTTSQPIAIGEQLELQALFHGAWYDGSPLPADGCGNTPPTCVVMVPGGHLTPLPWHGTTCAQCLCGRNGPAQPGTYRLVAHSCDATHDFVGPPFELPAH